MMNNPEQLLSMFKGSTERIKAGLDENNSLKEKLARNQAQLNRLNRLSLSTAGLIKGIENPSTDVVLSSLKCLEKVGSADIMSQKSDEDDQDQIKLIVGKYMNQVYAVIVDFMNKTQGKGNIVDLIELEHRLTRILIFGEEKQIIPKVDDQKGWKALVAKHQMIYDSINQMLGSEQE